MKICIIGAGSTYTPELVEGIINKRDTLPVTHLVFMDIDERKLNIVGSLCERMIKAAGLPCKTELVLNDYEYALKLFKEELETDYTSSQESYVLRFYYYYRSRHILRTQPKHLNVPRWVWYCRVGEQKAPHISE